MTTFWGKPNINNSSTTGVISNDRPKPVINHSEIKLLEAIFVLLLQHKHSISIEEMEKIIIQITHAKIRTRICTFSLRLIYPNF